MAQAPAAAIGVRPSPRRISAVVLVGIAAVSSAAILIRWAGDPPNGVPPLAIAAWRVGLASLVLLPVTAWRGGFGTAGMRAWRGEDAALAALSGLLLAVHFASWITSLSLTSVASSVVLVTSSPVWVAIGSFALLRERLSRLAVAGVAMAMAGAILLALVDIGPVGPAGPVVRAARDPLLGDLLALVGALSVSGYMLIGRRLRRRVPVTQYVQVVYGVAGLLLVGSALAAGVALAGFPALAFVPLVALALGPQLVGHTSFNWVLRYLSASLVAVVVLAEPVVATGLAYFLLGESLGAAKLVGAAVILGGIFVVAREEGRASSV